MSSAQPPAIRVTVNDRQLPVVAVMQNGRVLVPFRAVVEALGGRVTEFHLPLPPPAHIIAGRTYAPVRYLANMLHAQIEYDGRTRLVQVFTQRSVAEVVPTPPPAPLLAESPRSGSRVGTAYPTISATLPVASGTMIATVRMRLDGLDVTQDAHYAGSYITYIPRSGLETGTHTVAINGTSSDGRPFRDTWSFETTMAPAPSAPDMPYETTPIQFNVWGSQFVGGSPINVQLTGPPGGEAFAFVCTSAYRFPLFGAPGSQLYSGSVQTHDVGTEIDCPVTAMYIGWNGAVTYTPYPVFVHLIPRNTPAPTPTPVPSRIPFPTPTPRPTPKPTATPEPTATPRRTPHPIHPPIRRGEPVDRETAPPSSSDT